MDFFDIVKKLQLFYGFKLTLILCGNFYIAVDAGAVSLSKNLGLKLTCAQRGMCKIGIPKNSIKKYINKLDNIDYSYVILEYDKYENKIKKVLEHEGTKDIEYDFEIQCKNCKGRKEYGKSVYEKTLTDFIAKEFGDEYIW